MEAANQNANIAKHLPAIAEVHPDLLAVAVQSHRGGKTHYGEYTFAELNRQSDHIAHALDAYGIEPGMRTVLMVKPSLDFFALTFALFKVGAVPVLVDPGIGLKNLKECLAQAEPEAFVGIPKAHVARVLFGWAQRTLRKWVTVGRKLGWGGVTLEQLMRETPDDSPRATMQVAPEDMAAISFTSGSTGLPKGAVYTHGIFNAQVDMLKREYGISPGERDLATFPLFALFGPALGMAAIVPDMDASRPAQANPAYLVEAIETYECTNMFASPALIEVIGRYGAPKSLRLPSIRRVISAGAPANLPSIQRFTKLLADGVEVFPSYGATEALPVASIGSNELLETAEATDAGAGVCVGKIMAGLEVRIIKISDDPIPVWRDELAQPIGAWGEIVVKGPVVTREYYKNPEGTALAKIQDEHDGTFYHRMGDIGYFDETGRLWMCGRKSHRVILEDRTLFTLPCERILNTHPGVYRTALVGVRQGDKTVPAICVERNEAGKRMSKETLKQELANIAQGHETTRPIQTFLFHPGFPMDIRHNAKIFREQLAQWAERKI